MKGKKATSKCVLIEPIGIVERLSTDIIAVEDQDTADALRFIRENATANIRVNDVVNDVGISRRKPGNKISETTRSLAASGNSTTAN